VTGWERVAASIHPSLLRPAPEPWADYTIAMHHYILADLLYCTLCGCRPYALDQVMARKDRFGIATVLCLTCRRLDADRARMTALLEARYRPDRYAAPPPAEPSGRSASFGSLEPP